MTPPPRATAFEGRAADWLTWREAQARCVTAGETLPADEVPLLDARGRALAADAVATATLPPWDNSAMDGYAVRGEDVRGAREGAPVHLPVAGEVHAGDPPHPGLQPGTAVRIMTGAPVPTGADSVIRVEHTDAEEEAGTVAIQRDDDSGGNIRPGGQDVRAGETVLEAGHPVTPGVVGVLAALGRARVPVHRRPEVCIVPTGDELTRAADYGRVEAGRGIPESNGPMMAAAVAGAGARPRLLEPIPDDRDALSAALIDAARSDVVLTLGGASMGEADLVKRVLDELAYVPDFWRVRMRPGTPFGLGFLPRPGAGTERVPVFGLPGNPSSAFVTFELFVRPALLRMAGHRRILRRRVRAVAASGLKGGGTKAYFLRVELEDGPPLQARLTGHQSSGLVRGLAFADGLAVIPDDLDGVAEGDEVEVLLLDDAPGGQPWVDGA